jgi:hypothetical protein
MYYIICEEILEWSRYKENFDTRFIESIMDFYKRTGFFTRSQKYAIDNIVEKWNIPISHY